MTNPEVESDAADWFRSEKARQARAAATTVIPWAYDRCVEHQDRTFHIWRHDHAENYTAWVLTGQQPDGTPVQPQGTGHWTSLGQLIRRHGLDGSVIDDEANERERVRECPHG